MNHRIGIVFVLWSAIVSQVLGQSSPPNILIAIADDWGYGHASAYGAKWVQTPSFDRVAKQGILFRNAFTPNAKCAPSRACLLTGRNSWQLKEAANHICYFPAEFRAWPEVLAERGWHVGHTSKGWGPGVAKDVGGQNRKMTGEAYNRKDLTPATTGIGKNDYASNFEDFLTSVPSDRSWCFWYGAIEPHRGYEFGSGVAKGGKSLEDIDRVPTYWPDNEVVRNDMLDYAMEVEHFDHHLGRMLDLLERKGQLQNTLVIVTSDHGMPFPRCKGNAYPDSNHVPLAIMYPQGMQHRGRSVEDFVSFIDVAPTLLDYARIRWDDSGMAATPGRSLRPLFESSQQGQVDPSRDCVLVGMERHDIGRPNDVGYPIRGIVTRDYVYLKNFEPDRWPACNPETGYLNCDAGETKSFILDMRRTMGSNSFWRLCFGKRPAEELYRRESDQDCVVNLASQQDMLDIQQKLRDRMEQMLREQQDPRILGNGKVFDEYVHANPGHVHFYERYMQGEKLKTGWVRDTDYESMPIDD